MNHSVAFSLFCELSYYAQNVAICTVDTAMCYRHREWAFREETLTIETIVLVPNRINKFLVLRSFCLHQFCYIQFISFHLFNSHFIFDVIWCDFDRASSLICGNKMPTRCNRGFYCRSYYLLNMFRASLCPSSGAKEYYTVVAACGILCCGFFQVAGLVWNWGLCVRFAGCCVFIL